MQKKKALPLFAIGFKYLCKDQDETPILNVNDLPEWDNSRMETRSGNRHLDMRPTLDQFGRYKLDEPFRAVPLRQPRPCLRVGFLHLRRDTRNRC